MQVTNIKLFKSNYANEGSTKAFGQLELDNAIVLDIEVREKATGEQWVCFPGFKTVKDKTTNQEKKMSRVYIKDEGVRNAINSEVLGKFNRELREGAAAPGARPSAPAANTNTPFPF